MVNQLILTATIKSNKDEIITDYLVQLEYYDPKLNQWLPIVESKLIDSNLKASFNEKNTGFSNFIALFSKNFELGNFPMIRLVNKNRTSSSIAELISNGGAINYNPTSKTISIDFGNLWLYSKEQIKEQIDANASSKSTLNQLQIAIQKPNAQTQSYNNLQLALNNELTPLLTKANLELQRLTTENTKLQSEMVEMKKQHAAEIEVLQKAESPAMPAVEPKSIYSGIIDQMAKASLEMKGSPYEISNLKLDLKVLATNGEDGSLKLQMVDRALAEKISGDSLSMLTMDITPKDIKSNTGLNTMPKVIGLTETEARLRLAAFGLKMNPIYQATTKYITGQAFKQSPDLDTEIIEGSTVTVIFAKKINEFH